MIEKITLTNHIYFGHKYVIDMTQTDTIVIYDPEFTRFNALCSLIESVVRFLDTRKNRRAAIHYLTLFLREGGTKLLNPHKNIELTLQFDGDRKFVYSIGSKGGLISQERIEWTDDEGKRHILDRQSKQLRESETVINNCPVIGEFLLTLGDVQFKRPEDILPRDPALAVDNVNKTLFLINYFTKEKAGCVQGMINGKKEVCKDKRTIISKTISKWIINTNVTFQTRDTSLLPVESQLLIQSTFRDANGGLQTVGC